MKKVSALIIVLCIIGSLFISSSQTYEQQSLIPTLENVLPNKPFETALSALSIPYWNTTISVGERGYYHFVEFLLRKAAHFILFGLLAVGIFLSLPSRLPRLVIASASTLLLACIDETHQYFTGGRTATFRDVLLDMSGALTFLLVLQLIIWPRSKK
ncbi:MULTISPECIES: VanZ family protein [unclassified Sporosarcina]|uniref:VanZ family protein n=1 Tax=unclassified Sporosarcina TaxID=2647733 RepID=UPI000C1715F9|nr:MULTISPECIES: VanZ family protein [unclassified Sporosarcina]PID05908.1 VanZ family protein [Sporosarcina sp. P30]PID09102.1 VanZ family protein [Sporosarcina sp. P31]PID12399.1 VanZ family protein [Sporosarcina sp. P32b]